MKKRMFAVLAGIAAWGTAACGVELRGGAVSLALGRAEKGSVVSLRTPEGIELAAGAAGAPRLFTLTVSRRAEVPGDKVYVSGGEARAFSVAEEEVAGGGRRAVLTYEGVGEAAARVVCTVRTGPGDPEARWGIRVELNEGWVLEGVNYPCVTLAAPLGTGVDDDALVVGASKGGVFRKPGAMKAGQIVSVGQPGNMAAQFGCYYDDRAGFYTAAYDAEGHPKDLMVSRTAAGVEFSWFRPCFAEGRDEQGYEVVTSTFGGTGGAPAGWRDAADRYKAWALGQAWCAVPFARREDVPGWLKEGPAMVRFGRHWLAEPERIEAWLEGFWKRHFPEAPLITAYWGWEKRGEWVTPDYFPVFPSDERFAALVAKSRAMGCHAFPWPSGYHWTLTYNKQADGSFEWDDRERFEKVARGHAVHSRDGSLYIRTPSWLKGGNTACLCGGAPWTIRWWNEEICVPLARLGCEMVQLDQVVGGNWPACYAGWHGHPKGRGRWMTEAFAGQMRSMLEAMRRVEPGAVVCFEEPNEWFNHLVGLQDYRDCEAPREWASVFNYLYHEFLPPFQSNPRGNDRVMNAYCLADGQMPHLVPMSRDLGGELLVNGGFEAAGTGGNALRGWEQVRGYQGQAWTGLAAADMEERHGGASSLRLENAGEGETVQVSQNVAADGVNLGGGGRYRLSAWLKTGHMAQANSVNFGVFAPGLKSVGQGGRLEFPEAGAGWRRVSAEFTVPAGAEMLRIMCHVGGAAKVWVDDVTLEALAADGTAREVRAEGLSGDARFMREWVRLYHGEGRPWLMHGRLLHPPRLACATVTYRERATPAVFHNAFRAPDGEEAVVLANATHEAQEVALFWRGGRQALTLEAGGVRLVRAGRRE